MPYTTIADPRLQETVTLAEAYRILVSFIVQYNARAESSTVALMSDVGIANGQSADPAQLDDFIACAQSVIKTRRGEAR